MDERNASFIEQIIFNLPKIHPDDLGFIKSMAFQLESEGFSINDAVSYLSCTQEISPYMDEDVALERMYNLRIKYHNIRRDKDISTFKK